VRRSESVTFDELAVLCTSPGYVHAIAMFCFRDNVVRFDRELTVEDISHFHTGVGLTRSEISTLIGLLVKRPIDFRLPPPSVMQAYMNGTEQLLQELHEAMSAVWFRDLDPQRIADGFDPFFAWGSNARTNLLWTGIRLQLPIPRSDPEKIFSG
jgi:hypothetical protein